MKIHRIQTTITLGALVIAGVHVIWPALAIDAVTATLILAAIVPWLAPVFKKLKLPGGLELEFQELQHTKERAEKAGLLSAGPPVIPSKYSFQLVADEDPNLALAGLRIEIERRLVQIAEANEIDRSRLGLGVGALLHVLAERGILTYEQRSVLSDMLKTLNQAVHGVTAPRSAADWALQIGPLLLRTLDERIPQQGNNT
jgi:hypothetical protein